MEGEQERLERMYGELGDEHLKDLHDDRDSLTLDGQIALARVLARRGLAPASPAEALEAPAQTETESAPELEQGFTPGIPGVIPSGAGVMEQALEHGGARRDGMIRLVTFFDGTDLTNACTSLESENVDFALETMEHDERSGAPTSFAIWVQEADRPAAEAVLRRKMSLFPLPEIEGEPASPFNDAPLTLGEFETRDEAEQVKHLLATAGIAAAVYSSENVGSEVWHSVEVKGADLERGLRVVEEGLGAGQID